MRKAKLEKILERLNDIDLKQYENIKKQIEELKNQWYIVAIVHMTGDLTHAGHIEYIQTIRKKLAQRGISDDKIKLFVWIEKDERTMKRKWKRPILDTETRKFTFENIKWVDWAYVWDLPFSKEEYKLQKQDKLSWKRKTKHPSDLAIYLQPDIFIAHEEHINNKSKEDRVREKLNQVWVAFLPIYTKDTPELLWHNLRIEKGITTTNIVKRIVRNQLVKVIDALDEMGLDVKIRRKWKIR
jgi:hypothetical protein